MRELEGRDELASHHVAELRWLDKELRRRPGRAGRGELFYARLAVAYEEVVSAGTARARVELAQRLKVTPERVRDLLHEARRQKLLTPGHHGVAEGKATDRAQAIIAEADNKRRRRNAPGRGTKGDTSRAKQR